METKRYGVWFVLDDRSTDKYHVDLDPEVFGSWNTRIEQGRTIAFYTTRGDLVSINTKFLVTYQAREEES